MGEVFLINPKKKRAKRKVTRKRKTTTTRAKRRTTTKRRVTRKAAPRRTVAAKPRSATMPKKRKTTKKRTYKRNPSPRRRTYKRAARRVSSTFRGLNFKGALKNIPYSLVGMFGAKFLAKKFGGGALETDPESWGWKEYLQGALGATATAFLAQTLKPGSGQKVLEGGLTLMAYEMVQNELIAGSEWASGQFGFNAYGELGGFGEDDDASYLPGDVETDDSGKPYLLGQDYQWRELPEEGVSGTLQPVGPLGTLEPVGPLGGDDNYRKALLDT